MSNQAAAAQPSGFWSVLWDWITTVDHKKIGVLYLIAGGVFFLIGGVEALLIRMQLMFPESTLIGGELFNELMTMHGTTMIFLAAMPIIFALMNIAIPLQIGARDVAFPFLNNLGFWLFVFGGILLHLSWFMGGAPDAGWTGYVPLAGEDFRTGIDFYLLGLQISGFGTLMSGINFLVTVINMRAPGMTFMRVPMFTWSSFVASTLILFAFPPLTVSIFLLMFDRIFDGSLFVVEQGGNVIIWQHLFWIFGHPEVYILILPAFGIMSEVVATFAKKRLFGYTSMVFATLLIGFLGFMVWVHHMYTVGMGPVANSIFAVATMAIAVPTGIKIFNWLFTLWGGRIQMKVANLFALSFIPTFVMGGVTGVMLAVPAADYQYHDTYFVVAHFHYVIVGGVVLGLFAGIFYWWPKMFGKTLDERLGKWTFWLFLIGFHMTFFIQHFLGLQGMPRRVFTYLEGQGLDWGNFISSVGAIFMAVAVVIFLVNVVVTAKKDEIAAGDPWDGRTLEWSTPTPVPHYNFAQLPKVRALDTLWVEKQEGNGKVPPAEPVGEIHMPNNSFIPFVMCIGLFISGLGLCLHSFYESNLFPYTLCGIGLAIFFGSMAFRSIATDHGYHIPEAEVRADLNKEEGV